MITVDGQAVNPADDNETAVHAARLELRLCKALAALNPPRDVSILVYARTVELLLTWRPNLMPARRGWGRLLLEHVTRPERACSLT